MKKEKATDCLPCPFCGSTPSIVTWSGGVYVACDDCIIAPETMTHSSAEIAKGVWNDRPNPDAQKSTSQELELHEFIQELLSVVELLEEKCNIFPNADYHETAREAIAKVKKELGI